MAGKGLLWSDHGQVLLAEFEDQLPVHINYADASQVEIDRVHVLLKQRFELTRDSLPKALCKKRVHFWPLDDDKVLTYDPKREEAGTPGMVEVSRVVLMLAFLGAFIGFILWLVGIIRF